MFTAIGIISMILVARLAMRAARYQFGHGFGGPCGHFRRHARHGWHQRWHARHGAVDLRDIGTGDYDDYRDWEGMGMRRSPVSAHSEIRVKSIVNGLELNARQQAEVDDVLAVLRSARVGQLALALRACSRPSFDADLALAAIGPHASTEALDALEHLHTILTEEQRAALDRLTARS